MSRGAAPDSGRLWPTFFRVSGHLQSPESARLGNCRVSLRFSRLYRLSSPGQNDSKRRKSLRNPTIRAGDSLDSRGLVCYDPPIACENGQLESVGPTIGLARPGAGGGRRAPEAGESGAEAPDSGPTLGGALGSPGEPWGALGSPGGVGAGRLGAGWLGGRRVVGRTLWNHSRFQKVETRC